jgi:hypothetical protein
MKVDPKDAGTSMVSAKVPALHFTYHLEIMSALSCRLSQLQEEKALFKLSAGVYYCPKESPFGPVPPSDHELVKAFLKDDRFLLMSPNAYNI